MAWNNLVTNLPANWTADSSFTASAENNVESAANAVSAAVNAIVGGLAVSNIATSQNIPSASTSYVSMATADQVTATIGQSGAALVILTVQMTLTNYAAYASYALSGANTVAAADGKALYFIQPASGSELFTGSLVRLETGLTAGATTFTAQFRTTNSGYTYAVANRQLAVIPFP